MTIRKATPEAIAEASRILLSGGLVSFPTETVYGLGAVATNTDAVSKIFSIKGRPSINPLIVHVGSADWVSQFAETDDRYEKLARALWPGPISFVVKLKPDNTISKLVTAGLNTVAVRHPRGAIANELLTTVKTPLAAPSANKSGAVSPTNASHVAESLDGEIDMILDGGNCEVGLESTVLDISSNGPAVILRPGAVTQESLTGIIGPVLQDDASPDLPKSPGQMLSHYAPSLPVRLNALDQEQGEALLGFGSLEGATLNLSPSGNLSEAATNLFRMLRELDSPNKYRAIAVASIPNTGIGIAINDRLKKAARQ